MIGNLYLRLRTGYNPWRKMAALLLRQKALLLRARQSPRRDELVVSLTAIPARVSQLRYTLLSILNGEELPGRVLLYVSEATAEAIAAGGDAILEELVAADFLEIRRVEDVGPHTKLVYALADFPDKHIIVCDDDIVYPPHWVSALRRRYAEVAGERTIVCHRAHRVSRDAAGRVASYADWPKEVASVPGSLVSDDYFPTGTGGILFPAGSMPALTRDVEQFRRLAPKADDIWFWFCARRAGYTFSLTHTTYDKDSAPEIPNYDSPNLYYDNVGGSANDEQFARCQRFFAMDYGLTL